MPDKRRTAPPVEGGAVVLTNEGQKRRKYSALSRQFVVPSAYAALSHKSMVQYLLSLCHKRYHKIPFLSRKVLLRNARDLLEEVNDFEGLMRAICYCSEISKHPYTFKFVKLMYEKEFKGNANRDTTDRNTESQQLILPFD